MPLDESPLVSHALRELKILREIDPVRLQGVDDADIVDACKAFAGFDHEPSESGARAHRMFPGIVTALNGYAPLTPLTGDDDEWMETTMHTDLGAVLQNVRSTRVFKREDGTCFDVDAIVHRYPDGTLHNPPDDAFEVTFPYVPGMKVVDKTMEEKPDLGPPAAPAEEASEA
jgi:hypothetical protein